MAHDSERWRIASVITLGKQGTQHDEEEEKIDQGNLRVFQ